MVPIVCETNLWHILLGMGWRLRFWRRLRILPGVTVNLSKSGPSLSIGPRGTKVTIGRKGVRQTVGIPGSGLFATNYTPWEPGEQKLPVGGPPAGPSELDASPTESTMRSSAPQRGPIGQTRCGFCGSPAVSGQL